MIATDNAGNATTRIDADVRFPDSPHAERDFNTARVRAERLTRALLLGICAWSLIEAPLEVGAANVDIELVALIVSKLLVTTAAIVAVCDARLARALFSFICNASVLAIAPTLPLEYTRSVAIAALSSVECVAKAAYVIVFVWRR